MRETIELRIPEELAERHLSSSRGRRVGTERVLKLPPNDLLLQRIKQVDRKLRERGEGPLFASWDVRRRYARGELEEAELLHVLPKTVFEPAGEECGTVYRDSEACPECGAGGVQATPLFLDGRRVPQGADIAQTIADEIVVTRRVVELFTGSGLTGAELEPVRLSDEGGKPSSELFQLRVVGRPVELHASTRAGEDVFDRSQRGKCSRGHVVGLNLLSEVTVQRGSLTGADVMVTRQLVGFKKGLLRPRPILLVSPKAWRVMERGGIAGLKIEVAHLA